jgi:serine/threonine protein phosphatase PrpC
VIGFDREGLELITTNCGARVQQITDDKLQSLFGELEAYGVRHDDPYIRNVTYRAGDGRFCIIDFEFATLLDEAASRRPIADNQGGTRPLRLRWSGACELGWLRPNNEDRFVAIAFDQMEFSYLARRGEASADDFDFVFAVSDGMGGELSGEFASRCALDNITRLLPRRYALGSAHHRSGIYDCLEEVFQGTHRQLTTLSQSYQEGRNMGATLSMLWYVNGWFYFAHIGDSRIYHLPRTGPLRQLTDDHTHVGWLRRQGQLNEREARFHPRKNVLSQSLGAGNQYVCPQLDAIEAQPGDLFLLCTDGVMEGLWDHTLEELLRRPPADLAAIPPGDRIVQAALAESGRDNTTALVVEVLDVGPGPARHVHADD